MAHRAKHLRRNWTPEQVANHANQTRGTATTPPKHPVPPGTVRPAFRVLPVRAWLAGAPHRFAR